jgi:hypothetical protein
MSSNITNYGKRISWILLLLVLVGTFAYYRRTGQLAQFFESLSTPDKPTVTQKADTTITITKEETPRMIEIPNFHRLRSGIEEDDIGYIIHAHMRGDDDSTIVKIPVPARNDRPSDWKDPLAGKNFTRIGFTVDPSSTRDIGHIEFVIERQ